MKTEQITKKSWTAPTLTVHGDVATITQFGKKEKTLGIGDGHILIIPGVISVPIMDLPS